MRVPDNLELLLRDAPPATMELGRRVITFARLFATDARHAPAASVRVSLDRARTELDEHVRRRLLEALLDLARHHVYAALGPTSFAWLGEPGASVQSAWSTLEEHRDELPWLCAVPAPNETALQVTERLLSGAARLGLGAGEQRVWAARRIRAQHGPERGEQAFRELLTEALKPAGERSVARAALAGLVESALDRGAVRAARAALEDSREIAVDDPRLRRLLAWTCLLQDDEPGVRAAEAHQPEWRERIPLALAELRHRRPLWLPFLTGKVPSDAAATALEAFQAPPTRRHFGATLLAVFAIEPRGAHGLIHVDAAPGVRSRVAEWLRDRDGACLDPGEPEHRLIVGGGEVVVHRVGAAVTGGASMLRGTIAPAHTRALVLTPVTDERGELAGWLRLEFEHHLVPAQASLARAAAAWKQRVQAHRDERLADDEKSSRDGKPAKGAPAGRGSQRDTLALSLEAPQQSGPCADVFRELVQQLGMKTAQRHWWAFQVCGGRAELVAEGGAQLGTGGAKRGGGRGVVRALISAGTVRFDDPSPEIALDLEAASGVVVPLLCGRTLSGLLALESSRRKDFPDAQCERVLERCRAFATELRVARFREWHTAQFAHDVHFNAAGGTDFYHDVFACGRSRSPVSIVGPAGSGKRIAARWLHFESERREEPLAAFACGADESELWERTGGRDALVIRARRGTLLLDDIERLSERSQVRLLELLDARTASEDRSASPSQAAGQVWPRCVATSRAPLAEAVERGSLRHDLCERLMRAQLVVAPLARRRSEIPGLIAMCARRFAGEERLPQPTFSDEALAALWRQGWPGNVRQLENFIYKFVLLHAGCEVALGDVERMAVRYQLELVARLPSRNADIEAVRAALETTANLRGSPNKTRAALYLGWDPDTLVSRAGELGLLPGSNASANPASAERQ